MLSYHLIEKRSQTPQRFILPNVSSKCKGRPDNIKQTNKNEQQNCLIIITWIITIILLLTASVNNSWYNWENACGWRKFLILYWWTLPVQGRLSLPPDFVMMQLNQFTELTSGEWNKSMKYITRSALMEYNKLWL